jgi:hypothetical protein
LNHVDPYHLDIRFVGFLTVIFLPRFIYLFAEVDLLVLFKDWKIRKFPSTATDRLIFLRELKDLLKSSATIGDLPKRQSCRGYPLVKF